VLFVTLCLWIASVARRDYKTAVIRDALGARTPVRGAAPLDDRFGTVARERQKYALLRFDHGFSSVMYAHTRQAFGFFMRLLLLNLNAQQSAVPLPTTLIFVPTGKTSTARPRPTVHPFTSRGISAPRAC
jgi:hypothetical protein